MKRQAFVIMFLTVICLLFSSSSVMAKQWIINANNQLPADLEARVTNANGTLINSWDGLGIAVAEFDNDSDARSIESGGLDLIPDIEMQWDAPVAESDAQVDGSQEATGWWQYQWHLNVLKVFDAWATGARGAGVRVAVIDSGIDYNHPFFIGGNIDLASSATFVPGTTDCFDDHHHGTHVAGIIAAPGLVSWGVYGIAPEATIIPIKSVTSSGSGPASYILKGIIHAVNVDADIINLSLGSYLYKNGTATYTAHDAAKLKKAYTKTINWATSQGALVICSAGNDHYDMDHMGPMIKIPAECGNGIVVSATGPVNQADFDRPASYSNYGKSLVWVAAPGGDYVGSTILDMIVSTYPNNRVGFAVGTSQATPMVSGIAALILSKYGPMTPSQLKNHIAQTADDLGKPGRDDYYGRGRVNALRAVTE